MTKERHIEELYTEDPERADAEIFGRRADVSRRGFLGGAGLAAMGAAVGGTIVHQANMPGGLIPAAFAQDTKKNACRRLRRLVPRNSISPARTPAWLCSATSRWWPRRRSICWTMTPRRRRSFSSVTMAIRPKRPDADAWKLTIDGEVNKPLEITLGEIKKRAQARTYRMVLECGGNGRSFFTPQARGNQWTNGGAGCAEWTGIPLASCCGPRA